MLKDKFEVFDGTMVLKRMPKPPVVQIGDNGQIRFSVSAVKSLGLSLQDRLTFLIPKGDDEILYFYKHKDGLRLSKTVSDGPNGVGLSVCCRPLSRKLLDFFKLKSSTTFNITNDLADVYGEKMWFIRLEKKHIPVKWRRRK